MGRNQFLAPILVLLLAAPLGVGCASSGNARTEFEADRKARAHYRVGIEHLRQNRTAMAIRELRAAAQVDPADPWIQIALAEALRMRGHPDEAEKRLKQALALDPDLQPARLNLSALYVELGRYEPAIAEADRLIDDPTFPAPWKALANKGWAQYKLGKTGEARESLELALEFHPEFWPALLSKAVVDAEQGKRLDAIQGFEKVLQVKPGPMAEAEANYRLAEIYISLGNRRKAVSHLTAATSRRPSGEWGKRSAEYLERLR